VLSQSWRGLSDPNRARQEAAAVRRSIAAPSRSRFGENAVCPRHYTSVSRPQQSAIRNPRFAIGLLLAILTGCTGGGRLHFIEQQTKRIDERRALINTFGVDECYCWTDDEGRLTVAMRAKPAGLYAGTLHLSLVLTEPPAGSGKEYVLRKEAMRGSYGIGQLPGSRFRSLRGIAAVWPQADGTFKGRMRLYAMHRRFTLLLGWRPASTMLLTGEFRAVENAERGRKLLEASEDETWPRKAPTTTTAPTTKPTPTFRRAG